MTHPPDEERFYDPALRAEVEAVRAKVDERRERIEAEERFPVEPTNRLMPPGTGPLWVRLRDQGLDVGPGSDTRAVYEALERWRALARRAAADEPAAIERSRSEARPAWPAREEPWR